MLYTVAEVADLTNLSKVSIYKKLKLKEMKDHITRKQGVTYISEIGANLIKEGLKVKDGLKAVKDSDPEKTIQDDDAGALKVERDYILHLKAENERLWLQVQEKDVQLANLQRIVENSQILLKDKKPLQLEEKKSFFKRIFRI